MARVLILNRDWKGGRPYPLTGTGMEPFFRFKRQMREEGIDLKVRGFSQVAECRGYDAIGLVNKAFTGYKTDQVLEIIEKLRPNAKRILWLDHSDSTTLNRPEIIEFVDVFAKRSLLKDPAPYSVPGLPNPFDSFMMRYSGTEAPPPTDHTVKTAHLNKFRLSPSLVFDETLSLFSKPISKHLALRYPKGRKSSLAARQIQIGAPFVPAGIGRYRAYREHAWESLRRAGISVPSAKLSKKQYLRSLRQMNAAVSPFGHGELCYRDFEAGLSGVSLIKPDLGHLVSFPDILRHPESYRRISWDPERWPDELEDMNFRPPDFAAAAALKELIMKARSRSGALDFVVHLRDCLLSDSICSACRTSLARYPMA